MHKVRFRNIYILLSIYYTLSLPIITVLAIKAVGFFEGQTIYITMTSKIKHNFFYMDFFLFQTKKITSSWLKR